MILVNSIPDTEDYIELLPLKFMENIYASKASSHFLGGSDLAVLIRMAERGIQTGFLCDSPKYLHFLSNLSKNLFA